MFGSNRGMDDVLFQLKFCAKQLDRLSKKADKDEKAEKNKLKKALVDGDVERARIYAENAVRKKNESINYLRMSAKVDATASRVQSAVAMKGVTKNMAQVVKGLDKAINSMNLEQVQNVMDKFESTFEDLDVQSSTIEQAMGQATTTSTPAADVDSLMKQVADEAGMDISEQLASVPGGMIGETAPAAATVDDPLSRRLAALRE